MSPEGKLLAEVPGWVLEHKEGDHIGNSENPMHYYGQHHDTVWDRWMPSAGTGSRFTNGGAELRLNRHHAGWTPEADEFTVEECRWPHLVLDVDFVEGQYALRNELALELARTVNAFAERHHIATSPDEVGES